MRMFAPALAFMFSAIVSISALPQSAPQALPPSSRIGYSTVAEALAALRADPNVQITIQQGWTIAVNNSTKTIWAFVPKGDPAYPAVSKTTQVSRDGGIYIVRATLCEASKPACDHLVDRFKKFDERR